MNREYTRAPHRRATASGDDHSPHAALLIDFDNVTMAIRSNLGVEVRRLLDSDIIRGKVSVQRAYADWRRYPQYVLPLSEASIDLIYAPAYGSSKKNATDIRLAIDALELVFTRPEIGTFILLSGDSDFSSLVLKLKEYGKYVIGVGLQESSSDILVQNCDEYYSYNTISGLTSAVDGQVQRLDPWELVDRALERMVERDDVMRSDRLKQVMLEMDSSFDEKSQGFSKFNKFLAEAARRELVTLRKSENGQYDVALGPRARAARGGGAGAGTRPQLSQEPESASPRRRGRGGASRGRAERSTRDDRGREARDDGPAAGRREAPSEEREAQPPATPSTSALRRAYDLLRGAVRSLGADGEPVRDSEVKRQILAEDGEFDETALGFRKFSRFLQQAHDEGAIDLTQGEDGNYYLTVPEEGAAEQETRSNGGDSRGRGRRSQRGAPRGRGSRRERPDRAVPEDEADASGGPVPEAEAAAASAAAAAAQARDAGEAAPERGLGRFRRGSRGGEADQAGPAPTIGPVELGTETGGDAAEEEEASMAARREEPSAGGEGRSAARRGLGRFRRGSRGSAPSAGAAAGSGATAGAATPSIGPVEMEAPSARDEPTREEDARAEKDGEGRAEADGGTRKGVDASEPAGEPGAVEHMVRNYSGVGQRTAERLVREFGDRVFEVIDREPHRVTALLSEHRARAVLEAREAERQAGSAPHD